MIGTVSPTGTDAPKRWSKDHHGQKEQGTRHFQPQNTAHPVKRTQKAAHAARDARGRPPSLFAARRSAATSLRCGRGCAGHALAGHASGNSQPNAQNSPDGLRFHFDTMVAVLVAGAPGGLFPAARSCSQTQMEVR